MMEIDFSSRREQRKFGLTMASAIVVLGLVRWALRGGAAPLPFFYVAGAFLALALAAPKVLQPVFYAWMQFALVLNWIMTRVLLTVAFFVMIVPTRVVLACLGKDLLNRGWDPDAASYWDEPEEQPDDPDRYKYQF